jgi:beta-lactamase superfamily II metal-dependent hydrolase
VYEIDFLPVENEDQSSTHSGDAIAMRITVPGEARPRVVVVDGGYAATGVQLAEHIAEYYDSDHVDLVVSTHPDVDHINGLKPLFEQLSVGELLLHQPWLYRPHDWDAISNSQAIVDLYDLAVSRGVAVSEPFTGVQRFGGAITILGPSKERYVELLDTMVSEALSGTEAMRKAAPVVGGGLMIKATRVLERVLALFPVETLGDDDDDSPRNQSSAITLVQTDGKRMLLTGDAGIASLDAAADFYEALAGNFTTTPLDLFQAPHHGSKHNLGPTILNRIIGRPGAAYGATTAIASSAKSSEKHPSPKVTNALGRRGATVAVTEGSAVCYWSVGTSRPGWGPITPVGPLEEDE